VSESKRARSKNEQQADTQTDTQRHTETHRDTHRHRDRQTHRNRDTQRHRDSRILQQVAPKTGVLLRHYQSPKVTHPGFSKSSD